MTYVLWSFRRCPYAMRARLALASAGVSYEHREIVLRDKPAAFLAANPEGTVPVLVTPERPLIHSRDIMLWALERSDPEKWLEMPAEGHDIIDLIEGPFKGHLDRYKYHSRHPETSAEVERAAAAEVIKQLDQQLTGKSWLFDAPSLADFATLPFIRQFAHVDQDWFYRQPWPSVQSWLDVFKSSDRFAAIMQKHPIWQPPPFR